MIYFKIASLAIYHKCFLKPS